MHIQQFELKSEAIRLRKRGASIRDIEKRLGIARSTLSYWFRDVEISLHNKRLLKRRWDRALIKARVAAVKWHNGKKAERLAFAAEEGEKTLTLIDTERHEILELALALLYMGEGAKKSVVTAMGNSDPLILRFFVGSLYRLYGVPITEMKCELHLRADQNPEKIIKYWSKTLGIPKRNFTRPSLDVRTAGRPTYPHYNGVCIVRCSRVAIQRKLVYIAKTFCNQIAESVGG